MNKQLLYYFKKIGLLAEVPDSPPAPGHVLARGVCVLHDDADNPNSFLLYADGFACTTRRCHQNRTFGHNLEGLVRHMVYRLTGQVMTWRSAWEYAKDNRSRLKELVGNQLRPATDKRPESRPTVWSAEDLAACLDTPDAYYLNRGYRRETLAHFGVGTCVRPLPDGKNLPGWSIIPVLNSPFEAPLGYVARNPRWTPDSCYPKWINAVSRKTNLFNYWAASRSPGPAILCEGPGCVMRFHEAGYPGAVATLGNALTSEQYGLFLALYRNQKVYIAADADEPGRQFAEELKRRIQGVCIHEPVILFPPRGKDFGDLMTEEVKSVLSRAA